MSCIGGHATSPTAHPFTNRVVTFNSTTSSYNDPREYLDVYTELIKEHSAVITQHLPGYAEGTSTIDYPHRATVDDMCIS